MAVREATGLAQVRGEDEIAHVLRERRVVDGRPFAQEPAVGAGHVILLLFVGLGLAVGGHLAQATRLLAGIEVLGGMVGQRDAHDQRGAAGTADLGAVSGRRGRAGDPLAPAPSGRR